MLHAIHDEQSMMMKTSTILLVEDNRHSEALTLHAFQKNRIGHKVFVVYDEVEAFDYLFCTNVHSDRDPHDIPQPMVLDLKLPKVGKTVGHFFHFRSAQRPPTHPILRVRI